VSTRLIGGVIMTHGDDDGLRLPPRIAPRQIVIVPMLREKPEDQELIDYCAALERELKAAGIRVLVDKKPVKSAEKRWNWVRRGAPVIVEIGGRDAAGGNVTFMRRDALRSGDKVTSQTIPRDEFVAGVKALLDDIQAALFAEAKARLDGNIVSGIETFEALVDYFGAAGDEDDDEGGAFKGWVKVAWSKPEGTALDEIADRLKVLKLTIRNAPLGQEAAAGKCLFTGDTAREYVLIGRAY
jgi:prolyl-tRNA synthetase